MKIIIAGGGTGGHIFPAIAIADEITKRGSNNVVQFVGTKKGLENEMVRERNYSIEFISSGGIVGKGILDSLAGMVSAARGLFESFSIIRRFKPDAVLGVGGYASGPIVLAAAILRVPTAICEPNSFPGLTNRLLGKVAGKVFTAYRAARGFFPAHKIALTGNPVRQSILETNNENGNPDNIRILIFGGSQGSARLNDSVPKALGLMDRKDISVLHQTGKSDMESVRKTYDWYGISAEVLPFIVDMAGAYSRADFVVGRSGAGTVSELTVLGKPSLLIPYPYATHNHQRYNAKELVDEGAAVMLSDSDATPENIARVLTELFEDDKLVQMAQKAKALGMPNATTDIVDAIYELAGVRLCTGE